MAPKKLHPSVQKFKEYAKNNPKVIQEVRKGRATLQELYEDWYLLGEDDQRFQTIGSETNSETSSDEGKKSTESKGDWISNIMGMVKNMDANQVQNHINSLSQAIGAIQGVLSSFQNGNQSTTPAKPSEAPKNPFSFRKD